MLSDKRILEELGKGIVIEPFDKSQLGTNSYDLRLGENFYRPSGFNGVLDPYYEPAIKAFWQYWQARDGYIILRVGETVLAHTQEFVGGRQGFVGYLRARSSIGRIGISVAKCAGMGDVGYVNRWTMEITNHLQVPVSLKVGTRVAQMVFFEVGETLKSYKGKYQSTDDLEEMMKSWRVDSMLPKLWKDKDVK